MTDASNFGLSTGLQAHINGASSGHPIVIGTVDGEGRPHLSFYGTTQAMSETTLAIWVRQREGGLIGRIPQNPAVAFVYWNPEARVLLHLGGRARIAIDEETRTRVFERSPEGERRLDPERTGAAVVVDLDSIEGFADGQRFRQTRKL